MPTITTEVDVDLDEFETFEIIQELEGRATKLDEDDVKTLVEIINKSKSKNRISLYPEEVITTKDRFKYDLFMKYFDSITEEDLEAMAKRFYNPISL